MTDLNKFITDATRTESRIEHVNADFIFLRDLLDAIISLGEILDQVKKNVFYGKPFKDNVEWLLLDANESINNMLDKERTGGIVTVNDIDPRVFHGIVGLATESVELLQAMQTAIYQRHAVLDGVNINEELGDCDWYKAILYDALGLSWDDSLTTVIAKLKARFPDKFDSDKAINRDLTKERQILEGRPTGPSEMVKPKIKERLTITQHQADMNEMTSSEEEDEFIWNNGPEMGSTR